MKKIAILSDIHGNIIALEKVVKDLKTRQVDTVFNLGDHVSGPLWPKETICYLMNRDWIHILGNHDRQLVTQASRYLGLSDSFAYKQLNGVELEWLRSLPPSMEIQKELLLIHGTPSSDTTYLLETIEQGRTRLAAQYEIEDRLGETKSHIILCGHTHVPRIVEVSANKLIVNPGSVGLPAYKDEVPEYHVVETGSPHARYSILEFANDCWKAEMIAIPYEYHKAAAQARKNGRFDWEIGLRTGFMQ